MSANKIVLKIVSISFSILILSLLAVGLYQGGKAADRKSTRLNSSHDN